MGLFSFNYNKPGPGVAKDAPAKKGVPRFFEMLMRDYGSLWRVGLVTAACFVPMIVCAGGVYLFRGYIIPMAVGAVLYVLSAMLAGMATAAQVAVTLKVVRDIPGFVWHDYKKAWKDNAKQARAVGAAMFSLLAVECSSMGYMLFSSDGLNPVVLGMAVLGLLLCTGCGLLCFAQMVYLEMNLSTMVKNSLFLLFGFLNRTLPGLLFILVPYAAVILFVTPGLWTLFPLIGAHAVVLLIWGQWVWPVMESAFHISERQAERDARREAEAAGVPFEAASAESAPAEAETAE